MVSLGILVKCSQTLFLSLTNQSHFINRCDISLTISANISDVIKIPKLFPRKVVLIINMVTSCKEEIMPIIHWLTFLLVINLNYLMFGIFAETLVLGDNFIFLSDALSQNASCYYLKTY